MSEAVKRPVCAMMAQALRQVLARCAGGHSLKLGVAGAVQERKPVFEGN